MLGKVEVLLGHEHTLCIPISIRRQQYTETRGSAFQGIYQRDDLPEQRLHTTEEVLVDLLAVGLRDKPVN